MVSHGPLCDGAKSNFDHFLCIYSLTDGLDAAAVVDALDLQVIELAALTSLDAGGPAAEVDCVLGFGLQGAVTYFRR